jgi:hypothetical protein
MNKVIALLLSILFFCNCDAQFYVEPIVGFQKDLSEGSKLKQINSAINIAWKVGSKFELILQGQRSWPISYKSSDAAYTTNPALPVSVVANKTISPSALSLLVGQRTKIWGRATNNSIFFIAYIGVSNQKVKVDYSYDKTNYTILNPDKSLNETGLYLAGGAEYMRNLKFGRIFTQLMVGGFVHEAIKYPNSFNFLTPFTFNIGYSIPLFKKIKDEKK